MSADDSLMYDPAVHDYQLSMDPRCLWGWGPPRCNHMFGHMCARPLGHPGKCHDATDTPRLPCSSMQRPKNWDATGRAEAAEAELDNATRELERCRNRPVEMVAEVCERAEAAEARLAEVLEGDPAPWLKMRDRALAAEAQLAASREAVAAWIFTWTMKERQQQLEWGDDCPDVFRQSWFELADDLLQSAALAIVPQRQR